MLRRMRNRVVFGLLLAVVCVSGAAALTLQVVWTRWIVLAVGNSSVAAMVVLSVFMAGLGLGALWAGRIADLKPSAALRFFAIAEAGVAIWAVASIPLAGRWLPEIAAYAARALNVSALPTTIRVGMAVVVLLPPTVLMGASLPVLIRWAVSSGLLAGRSTGGLYAANAFGGALGAVGATFLLIDRLGFSRTVALVAVADGAVACIAWALFQRTRGLHEVADPAIAPQPDADLKHRFQRLSIPAFAYFVSGFLGLALEVLVHRTLNVVVGSSAYSFALMLAVFLTGISLGSYVAARWADRLTSPVAWMGITLGGLAFGIGIANRLLGTPMNNLVLRIFGPSAASSWALELTLCAGTLLPATTMLGVVVPLVGYSVGRSPNSVGSNFGRLYAANTLGAVLGALAAGSLLIPHLGSHRALITLTLVAGVAGIIVVVAAGKSRAGRLRDSLTIAVLTALGWWLSLDQDPIRRALTSRSGTETLLELKEGPVQTVGVFRVFNELQLEFLRITADRTTLAATNLRARRYMSLLGHLPALWGAPPKTALVICFGTGTTAAAVAAHRSIERLDIAEISPEVIALAPNFRAVNHDVLADSRVRLHVEDGRHIALASRTAWDLITLEPPPPRDSGVVALYSIEFYELCRSRMTATGVMAQWCPLESQSKEEVRMVIRTFLEAFPHVLAFLPVERDLLLLGSSRPLVADLAEMRRRFQSSKLRDSLREIGIEDPVDLLASLVADRNALEAFSGSGPIVGDDRPRLEYFARYGRSVERWDPSDLVQSQVAVEALVAPGSRVPSTELDVARSAQMLSNRAGWVRTLRRDNEWLPIALQAARLRPDNAFYLYAAGISDEHLARLRSRAEHDRNDARLWFSLGVFEAERGRTARAEDAWRHALAVAPAHLESLFSLAALLSVEKRELPEARSLLQRYLELAPPGPDADRARRMLGELDPG